MRDYVVGFAFSKMMNYVALVWKDRPVWQKGLLNGVGGKIEPGESPLAAQVREWGEECRLTVDDNWIRFAVLIGGGVDDAFRVVFHWTLITFDEYVTQLNYGTDEHIEVYPTQIIMERRRPVVSNVPMLLELAWLSANYSGYRELEIREKDLCCMTQGKPTASLSSSWLS